jgi:hypothetical protein
MVKKLTMAEHQELGRQISEVRAILIKAACALPNTYGKTSRVGRLARRAFETLQNLQCELDDRVFRDHPKDGATHIYYPFPQTIVEASEAKPNKIERVSQNAVNVLI